MLGFIKSFLIKYKIQFNSIQLKIYIRKMTYKIANSQKLM